MKSIEELRALKEKAKKKIEMRQGDKKYKIVVGMGTCGIASGAKNVLNVLLGEVDEHNYSCSVTQCGCIGMCSLEPIVEVFDNNDHKTTYVKVDAEKAKEILEKHIANDEVIVKYTHIGNEG